MRPVYPTLTQIASALCADNFHDCAHMILPPWMEEDDSPIREAYSEVQTLRRQRTELTEMFPHKKAELQRQCNDTILDVAVRLRADLFDL